MIIQFSRAAINQRAVAALLATKPGQLVLSPTDLNNSTTAGVQIDRDDHTLVILDLAADGYLQKLYSAELLAETLFSNGLLDHINTVQILVSDVIPNQAPLLGYATKLSIALISIRRDCEIDIQVLADLVEATLVEPPHESDGEWSVYQGYAIAAIGALPDPEAYFDYYRKQMHLLSQGPIALELQKTQYTISYQSVKRTYFDTETQALVPIQSHMGLDDQDE